MLGLMALADMTSTIKSKDSCRLISTDNSKGELFSRFPKIR